MNKILNCIFDSFKKANHTVGYINVDSVSYNSLTMVYIPLKDNLINELKEKYADMKILFDTEYSNSISIGFNHIGNALYHIFNKDESTFKDANGFLRISVNPFKRDILKQILKDNHIIVHCNVKDMKQLQKQLEDVKSELDNYKNFITWMNE